MRRFWTAAEDELLRSDYSDTPTAELARQMDRSERAVYARAYAFGLKKSPAYLASEAARRFDGQSGAATRFTPGHRTWNKGMIGWKSGGRSEKTRFRKGNRPVNWRPLGSFRMSQDGYLQKKMTDTGRTTDWVGVQAVLWQRKYGPIPPGHIVVFRDGDRTNFDIDNFELISRSENMTRNNINRYPPYLRYVMRLNAKLRRAIEGNI